MIERNVGGSEETVTASLAIWRKKAVSVCMKMRGDLPYEQLDWDYCLLPFRSSYPSRAAGTPIHG